MDTHSSPFIINLNKSSKTGVPQNKSQRSHVHLRLYGTKALPSANEEFQHNHTKSKRPSQEKMEKLQELAEVTNTRIGATGSGRARVC